MAASSTAARVGVIRLLSYASGYLARDYFKSGLPPALHRFDIRTYPRTTGQVSARLQSEGLTVQQTGLLADYSSASGVLNWADGDSSTKSLVVRIANNLLIEGSETVRLGLNSPDGGATRGTTAAATLTIADDECSRPIKPSLLKAVLCTPKP